MKILVTGATGFIGKKLCEALFERGDEVVAVVRGQVNANNNITIINKVLTRETDWQDSLKGVSVVIHLAGRAHVIKDTTDKPYQAYAEINIHATKHLAEQAALSGVKRFIFLSSIKVNGESTSSHPFTESDIPKPQDDYGKTKAEAELLLDEIAKNSNMQLVVIRPPLVYGKGVQANFKSLIKLAQLPIPLPFDCINNKRSLVFIDNLIDFIILCTHHTKATNQTFLISDDEDISTTELIKYIKEACDKSSWMFSAPMSWLKFLFKMAGKSSLYNRLCGSLQVDVSKAKALLDWQPPHSVKNGIEKTVRSIDK